MRKRRRRGVSLRGMLCGVLAGAAGVGAVDLSGSIENWTGYAFENKQNETILCENRLNLTLERDRKRVAMLSHTRIRHDALRGAVEVRLRETWLALRTRIVDVRIGKQYTVWGISDGFFLTDFSPLDLRTWLIPEMDELRLAQTGARAVAQFGNVTLELTGIVAPRRTLLASSDSRWYPGDRNQPLPFEFEEDREVLPPEAGARVSALLGRFDVTATYSRTTSNTPIYSKSPQAPTAENQAVPTVLLTPHYHTENAAGGYATVILPASMMLKLEGVYDWDTRFDSPGLSNDVFVRDVGTYVLGVESAGIPKTTLGVQYYQQRIVRHTSSMEQRAVTNRASLRLNVELHKFVDLELFSLYDLDDPGAFLKSEIVWSIADGVKARAGYFTFAGEEGSEFGPFIDNDFANARVEFFF